MRNERSIVVVVVGGMYLVVVVVARTVEVVDNAVPLAALAPDDLLESAAAHPANPTHTNRQTTKQFRISLQSPFHKQ